MSGRSDKISPKELVMKGKKLHYLRALWLTD